jgi:predicted permease
LRLRDTPGITAIAVASLAFGIGLNVLIFSFTSPVLFKALPYPEPGRLLDVSMAPPGKPEAHGPVTPPLYVLLRDRTSAAFEAIGVFDAGRSASLARDAGGPAEWLEGHRITATGLAALGAAPLLGKLPVVADEQAGATPTMLLSYPLWQRRFAGRSDVVNQTVQVDGRPTRILGVMPEGFGLLDNSSDAWFTFGFEPTPAQQFQHSLRAAGRLKPGVSLAQAQDAVKSALDEYARTFPNRDKGWTVELTPWREARFGGLRRPLTIVQLAVGGMLLLLCVNVSHLRAARYGGQAQGRRALGQILMLSLAGGAIGALIVWLGLPALRALAPRVLPRLDEVTFDASVLVFSVVLCVLTALVIRIVPALRRWPGAIVFVTLLAVQMTLAFVLLAGAGLAIRAFGDLGGRDVGVNASGLLSVDVHLPRDPYVTPDTTQAGSIELAQYSPEGPAIYDRIRAALQTMPGVVQAAGVGTQPFASAPFVQCWIGDQEHTPDNQVAAQYLAVTENYFNTMGIRVVRGRDFSPSDQPASPWVVLVNETMARQNFATGDPIGQKLTLTFHPNDGEPPRQIVGVVADTLPFRGASEVPPLIFVLHRQQATEQRASLEGRRTVMSFVARTTGDPLALGGAVRELVGKIDATTPVASIRTVESYLNDGQVKLLKFAAVLFGVFALVGVVIGAAGMSAYASAGVSERRSRPMLVLGAVGAVAVGIAAGLEVWRRLGSVIDPFLTNLRVTPSDPGPLVVTGGVLLVMALGIIMLASFVKVRERS